MEANFKTYELPFIIPQNNLPFSAKVVVIWDIPCVFDVNKIDSSDFITLFFFNNRKLIFPPWRKQRDGFLLTSVHYFVNQT